MYSLTSEMSIYFYWKQVLYVYVDVVNILGVSLLGMCGMQILFYSNRNIQQPFYFCVF
jgi:hypothetical protein